MPQVFRATGVPRSWRPEGSRLLAIRLRAGGGSGRPCPQQAEHLLEANVITKEVVTCVGPDDINEGASQELR